MKSPQRLIVAIFFLLLFLFSVTPSLPPTLAQSKKKINSLTEAEKKEGWKLLFNGNTLDGWRGAYMDSLPRKGWEIKDGILDVQESGGGEASFGGDLVIIDEFTNFDLKVEFKLTSGANSGIKYFVIEQLLKTPGSAKGLEYQLLDDAKHPDA